MANTITPSALEQTDPIKYTQPQDNTDYSAIINNTISSIPRVQQEVDTAQGEQDTILNQVMSDLSSTPSYTELQAQQDQTNNVKGLQETSTKSQNRLRELAAQSDALAIQNQIIPLEQQQKAFGQGVTDRGIQPLTQGALRENAIRQLTIAQQANIQRAVAENDFNAYNTAKETARQAVELSFKDRQIKNEAAMKNLELISTYKLAPKQKELATAREYFLSIDKENIKNNLEKDKYIADLIITASVNGLDPQTIEKIKNAKSKAEAAQLAGKYGGDLAQSQIESTKLYEAQKAACLIAGEYSAEQIAMAIKQQESGGNYGARGASTENGAYQFMPATWKEWAKKWLGNPNAPMTSNNQDKVAISQIKEWQSQGYNAQQIASMWNSGSPNWEGKTGKNSYGVPYDVPAYVNGITKKLAGVVPANGGVPLLTPENQQKVDELSSALSIANDIKNFSGKNWATGATSFLGFIPGTQSKDFKLKVDQLKNALAKPNLGSLKGAMSDKDLEFIKNIATSLDVSMTDATFNTELEKVINTLKGGIKASGGNVVTEEDVVNSQINSTQSSTPSLSAHINSLQ